MNALLSLVDLTLIYLNCIQPSLIHLSVLLCFCAMALVKLFTHSELRM